MINMTNAIKNTGAKVVMKNNTAECVLLSPDEYIRLMDEVNDARLLNLANKRMQNYNSNTTLSSDEVFRNLGISDKDLQGYDEVEFE